MFHHPVLSIGAVGTSTLILRAGYLKKSALMVMLSGWE